jgi:hypothetical protein
MNILFVYNGFFQEPDAQNANTENKYMKLDTKNKLVDYTDTFVNLSYTSNLDKLFNYPPIYE